MRIKRVAHARHAQIAGINRQITPYSCGGSIAMMPHSVSELRIPIRAAPLRRGVENGPQRIEFGRAAWILTGIGGARSHFPGPEMANAAVASREHGVARRVGIASRDIIARKIAGHVRIDFMPGPAPRLLGFD